MAAFLKITEFFSGLSSDQAHLMHNEGRNNILLVLTGSQHHQGAGF